MHIKFMYVSYGMCMSVYVTSRKLFRSNIRIMYSEIPDLRAGFITRKFLLKIHVCYINKQSATLQW